MAKIKEVTISLGMSFNTKMEGKDVWVKPQVGFRIETDGEEASDEKARREILRRAFDVAEEELSEELQRLLSDNES